ncbi:hypothetical protein AADZ84_09255 [Colwelliaceae bacterium MEBiC 14330]
MNKYLLPPLLLTTFLQACGGSSPSTPEVPVEPIEYSFSLTAQLTNACGAKSAFTDIELLLQDDNWQTLNRYSADENGVISFVTTNEFINYTIVAKDQQGTEAEGLNVVSFYQASSNTPAHYQARFDNALDNSNCECVSQNLELTHRPFTTQVKVTSSLPFDNWLAIDDKTTLFEGVEVCREIDGDWPLHSFSVSGTDNNEKEIASAEFVDDFTSDGSGAWRVSAFQVADSFELAAQHQAFTTHQVINNSAHFSSSVAEDDESLLVFSTHDYISEAYYQSKASITFDESSSIFGSSVIKTQQQLTSTDKGLSFAVKASESKPNIDDRNFSEIKADGSYDYSAVNGYPMAIITFTFTAFDPESNLLMPAKWSFYGPEQGTLAISAPLTGYEDIISIDTDKKSTEVRLIQSLATDSYQDYIKFYQGEYGLGITEEFAKNVNEVEISITLN